MARIFKTPFGAQGDTEQVPEAPQGDGSVSLTQGFGYDYEREYEDPAAKDIRREVMNGLFHDITEAIGDIQLSGIAKWSADAAPYPAGAVVWHDSVAWMSTAGNNSSEPGVGAEWSAVLSKDAFQGVNQALSGNGYQILPGGLIIQWGSVSGVTNSGVTFSFPIAFPNQGLQLIATDGTNQGSAFVSTAGGSIVSNTEGYVVNDASGGDNVVWLAIGY